MPPKENPHQLRTRFRPKVVKVLLRATSRVARETRVKRRAKKIRSDYIRATQTD
jgi:hypothetical protein